MSFLKVDNNSLGLIVNQLHDQNHTSVALACTCRSFRDAARAGGWSGFLEPLIDLFSPEKSNSLDIACCSTDQGQNVFELCDPMFHEHVDREYHRRLVFLESETLMMWAIKELNYRPTADDIANGCLDLNVNCNALKLAYDNNCWWDVRACSSAAFVGNLSVLRCLLDLRPCYDYKIEESAAKGGHKNILEYLRCDKNNYPWDKELATSICSNAAEDGHIHVLEYMQQKGYTFDATVMFSAARGAQMATIEYLVQNKCPSNKSVYNGAAMSGNLKCLQWLWDTLKYPIGMFVLESAAWGGNLEMVKWVYSMGSWLEVSVMLAAISIGNEDIVIWLHEQRCPFHESCITAAIVNGHINILEFLFENNYPSDTQSLCGSAFMHRDNAALRIVFWLRERDIPWGDAFVRAIETRQKFSTLQKLLDCGCPWDSDVCAAAARVGDLEGLQWLRSRGCPWNSSTIKEATINNHPQIIKWAIYAGCP